MNDDFDFAGLARIAERKKTERRKAEAIKLANQYAQSEIQGFFADADDSIRSMVMLDPGDVAYRCPRKLKQAAITLAGTWMYRQWRHSGNPEIDTEVMTLHHETQLQKAFVKLAMVKAGVIPLRDSDEALPQQYLCTTISPAVQPMFCQNGDPAKSLHLTFHDARLSRLVIELQKARIKHDADQRLSTFEVGSDEYRREVQAVVREVFPRPSMAKPLRDAWMRRLRDEAALLIDMVDNRTRSVQPFVIDNHVVEKIKLVAMQAEQVEGMDEPRLNNPPEQWNLYDAKAFGQAIIKACAGIESASPAESSKDQKPSVPNKNKTELFRSGDKSKGTWIQHPLSRVCIAKSTGIEKRSIVAVFGNTGLIQETPAKWSVCLDGINKTHAAALAKASADARLRKK